MVRYSHDVFTVSRCLDFRLGLDYQLCEASGGETEAAAIATETDADNLCSFFDSFSPSLSWTLNMHLSVITL